MFTSWCKHVTDIIVILFTYIDTDIMLPFPDLDLFSEPQATDLLNRSFNV